MKTILSLGAFLSALALPVTFFAALVDASASFVQVEIPFLAFVVFMILLTTTADHSRWMPRLPRAVIVDVPALIRSPESIYSSEPIFHKVGAKKEWVALSLLSRRDSLHPHSRTAADDV